MDWQHVFWALCAFCLSYWEIQWCFQQYSKQGGAAGPSLSLANCSAGSLVVSFLQIRHTGCFTARSLLLVLTRCLQVHRVGARRSFLTNFALSLHSPWHSCCRYKPASADNAADRNAPSIPNKQDAQPWGEQELQLAHRLSKSRQELKISFISASEVLPLLKWWNWERG